MIWLFELKEVFWNAKPNVDEYYTFDTNDIEFDLNHYDISLYFPTTNYFILSDSNDREIYNLRFVGANCNPVRILVSEDIEFYNIVRNFYMNKKEEIEKKNGNK